MFSYSRDIDGKSLFILKCKKHVKGQRSLEELKRCLVYWFERLERYVLSNTIINAVIFVLLLISIFYSLDKTRGI